MNKLLSFVSVRKFIVNSRTASSSTIKTRINAEGKDVPKVLSFQNRITLITSDNAVSITDLKNAQNLAAKKNLKLVKIEDSSTKTRRPVYKLISNSEYHEEELQKRKERQENKQNSAKGEKLLTFSTRIGEHDLLTNVRKMSKLLNKQFDVRIVISKESGENDSKAESFFSLIEKNVKDFGKIVQKRTKGNTLRFQILSLKEQSANTADSDCGSNGQQEGNKGPL